MMPLNIEARYPEYKESLLKKLSPEYCEKVLNNTNTFYLWIKNKLYWLETSSSLWGATWDVNTLIEPVLMEDCHPSPLYEDVMRTGIAI